MKRKSVKPNYSMCVQPAFIIGTNNEDGSENFAPITWVSATCEEGDEYMLVISMFGTKRTKQNVIRTGLLRQETQPHFSVVSGIFRWMRDFVQKTYLI